MKPLEAAYIAGFFDGDGSVRIQFQPRKNARLKFRVRAEISFAQKIGHEKQLLWIREKLGIGYIYTRNDGMSELKVEGFKQVKAILQFMTPFVHFKEKQVQLTLTALSILDKDPKLVTSRDLIRIAQIGDQISSHNYVTVKKKYTAAFITEALMKIYPRND